LELLGDTTVKVKKLDDLLSVRRELGRVREEIERMKGRIRLLDDRIAKCTVTLSVTEIKDYVPEQAPTYSTRIARAFQGSISNLVSFVQDVSIGTVALAPWLGVLLVPVIAVAWYVRVRRRRRR